MSQGGAIDKTLMQCVVNDGLPDSTVDGTVQAISLTKQGQIRVATVEEDIGVTFFASEMESLWGEGPSFTPGSPW